MKSRRHRPAIASLVPDDPSWWTRHLDCIVNEALSSARSDLVAAIEIRSSAVGRLLDLRVTAAAWMLLSIEKSALSREDADALFRDVLALAPGIETSEEPAVRRDWEDACTRGRDLQRLLRDLSSAGREDIADGLRSLEASVTAEVEDLRAAYEEHGSWVADLVAAERGTFRWMAFLDMGSSLSLVRLLLGLLVAERAKLLSVPVHKGPGQPLADWVGLPLYVETLLFPRLPMPGAALARHLRGETRVPRSAAARAVKAALGIEAFGSPREPILRALAAAGVPWAPTYLGSSAPGAKHLPKARHHAQLRNARTRAARYGLLGGEEALRGAAASALLRAATALEVRREGSELEVLLPGARYALHEAS